jgi:hypothetical protein
MAKALIGQRMAHDPRMALELVELRRRVRDLEGLVERLQRYNDRLQADLGRPDPVPLRVPTIAG